MSKTLYPHQVDGVTFLTSEPFRLLADEPGCGKTCQCVTAARKLVEEGKVKRILVLAPLRVLPDWYAAWQEWAPELQVWTVTGGMDARSRRFYWLEAPGQVFMTSYELWRNDHKMVPKDHFDLHILDEVQRIKNAETSTFKSVKDLRIPRRWGVSGTPLENNLKELITICSYVLPDVQIPNMPEVAKKLLEPHLLRRTKEEVLKDLPPKDHRTEWLPLAPEQRNAYNMELYGTLDNIHKRGFGGVGFAYLGLLVRLKKLCNIDPATGASSKVDYLMEELPKVYGNGEKALIFSQYPNVTLRAIAERIGSCGKCAIFDGKMSQSGQRSLINDFQEGDTDCLLMSLKAGGVGITLTRATRVYHFDHWWNPAIMGQAEDRAHRIGQTKPVKVVSLMTADTIEERINQILGDKQELFDKVMTGQSIGNRYLKDPNFLVRLFRMERAAMDNQYQQYAD